MLHAKSHHPEQIKRATIVNTITTYEAICSNDTLLKEAEVLIEDSDTKWLQKGICQNFEKKENYNED